MRKPVARPTQQKQAETPVELRAPRAFTPPKDTGPIETFTETEFDVPIANPPRRKRHWLLRILAATFGILVSLALGLAAEALIRDLFDRYEWLGWAGLAVLGVFVLAVIVFIGREVRAVARLRKLDALRTRADKILESDKGSDGKHLVAELTSLYRQRADLARPRTQLEKDMRGLFDGADMINTAETNLMAPLDAKARALTSAAARRVAIVTAISPRALVDIAFVAYESFKLARAVAELYGVRPGLFGSWRLTGEILGHLAVTGGVALGDSVVQQLLGHGLAAKVSARLGEGLVNGLMTVRVGIAAMRVTRPLPFKALKQPLVMDFMADLAKIGTNETK